MNKFLIVIDVQNNFIRDCRAENVLPNVINKIKRRKKEGYEVLFTLDKSGGELCKGVKVSGKIFKKHSYGCAELISYLKEENPSTVEFIGVCTDICVITNVLAAMTVLPFSSLIVDGSCCASQSVEKHKSALELLRGCNVDVI